MTGKQASPLKKYLILCAKLAFVALAVYLIVSSADLNKIGRYFASVKISHMLLALLILNVGQVISAFRLRYYFSTAGIHFTRYFIIALYYTGMFFNRLLPSGVGGDGYNTYLLKRYKKISIKTTIKLFLASRANGLLFVFFWAFVFLFSSQTVQVIPYGYLLGVAGAVTVLAGYFIGTRILLGEKLATQTGGSKFSVFVQGAVALAAFVVLLGVGHEDNFMDYLMMFMFANAFIFLPISVGGMGIREFVYFYGATFAGLDAELGVTISVLYFLLETVSSVFGIFFWHRINHIDAFAKSKKEA